MHHSIMNNYHPPHPSLFLLLISLFLIPAAVATQVNYTVINKASNRSFGGRRFERRIGFDYTLKLMSTASHFIWDLLHQTPNNSRHYKDNKVTLYIDPTDTNDGVSAYARGNMLHISASYIGNYTGNVKEEFTGVVYHLLAYTWMWDGRGRAPQGLRSGMAELVRIKAGYGPWMAGMGRPGRMDGWDKGYGVTALFLDYCNDLGGGVFLAEFNRKMKRGYRPGFFRDLLGNSVDVLWQDYKSKYHLD